MPAVGVGVDHLILGCAEGGEDEPFTVVQPQGREVDEAPPDGPPPRQPVFPQLPHPQYPKHRQPVLFPFQFYSEAIIQGQATMEWRR